METDDFFEERIKMERNKLADDPEYIEIHNIIEKKTEYENWVNDKEFAKEKLDKNIRNDDAILPSLTQEQKEKKDEDYALDLIKGYGKKGILRYLNVNMNWNYKEGIKGTIKFVIEKTNKHDIEYKITLIPKYREKIVFTI
jgi:hypothetical protein